MIELTVGYVAGIIALGIVAAQIWCPTALTLVLAGQLGDTESAATWNSAGRHLQASFWPLILRCDSTRYQSTPKLILFTTFSLPVITIIIAIAGIITPLGLYEEYGLAAEATAVEFKYVKDSTTWFAGTSPRGNASFTRKCFFSPNGGHSVLAPCPYVNSTLTWREDGIWFNTTTPQGIDVSVPKTVKDIYSSDTSVLNTTVSNFFDIQWRQVTNQFDEEVNNGTRIAVGQFQQLESFISDDAYRIVEGLVVNAKTGGIGFRNHTLPVGYPRGVEWSEDLLFLEPDVECANTNITLDFGISTTAGGVKNLGLIDLVLTDRGGFANLNTTIPLNDTLNESNVPKLKVRAYSAAWLWNVHGMFLMNVTNPRRGSRKPYEYIDSKVGKTFKLPPVERTVHAEFMKMHIYSRLGTLYGMSSFTNESSYANPWNITGDDFDSIRELCQITPWFGWAKPNATYVGCNLVRGAPKRVDQDGVLFQDGSRWSSPLYACASAVKATVKTVKFLHNGTSENLQTLFVKEIYDKQYKSLEDMPLWGFESLMYRLNEHEPVWGLVNKAYEGFPNITILQAPSLYMLGSANDVISSDFDSSSSVLNLPAALGPQMALSTVVNSGSSSNDEFDFFGRRSLSTWLRWQNLSESEETVPKVIKLLWTDLAASAMVGTKGVLGSGNVGPDRIVTLHVLPITRKIKFRYAFGIPAFAVAICIIICTVLALVSMLLGHSSFDIVGQRLKQTSVGRALTTAFYPESSNFGMSTRRWVAVHGSKKLDLTSYAAPAIVPPPLPLRPGERQATTGKHGSHYSAVPMSDTVVGY